MATTNIAGGVDLLSAVSVLTGLPSGHPAPPQVGRREPLDCRRCGGERCDYLYGDRCIGTCSLCRNTGLQPCATRGCTEPVYGGDFCDECSTKSDAEDSRRFTTSESDEGYTFSLVEMIAANVDDHELVEQLRSMDVGARIHTGGGAAASGWVECVGVA